MSAEFEWLAPWQAVRPAGSFQQNLVAELLRELAPGHKLFGLKALAIGRRADCDDVLFQFESAVTPLAVVHLTWSGKPERRTEWPSTELFSTLDVFVEARMRPDHQAERE